MARTKKVVEAPNSRFTKPTVKSFDVIIRPIITEKTMKLMQEENKVTFEVAMKANRTEVKLAFESIFQVKAENVTIIHVRSKAKRAGRYEGSVPAYKKAIITLAEGEALDLFKE